jgi:hypothetical protein
MRVTNECIYKRKTKVKYFHALKESLIVIELSTLEFFVVKICQNVEKKRLVKTLLEKNGLKKISPYFDLSKAHDATHAMHVVDPSLLVLQGTHLLLPHFLKQQPIVNISCLLLLDITNFITTQEVLSPSLNKKEKTCVAKHIVSSICFCHIILLGHIYFL